MIKLINGQLQIPCIQKLVEQANGIVKNKITQWQAEHVTKSQVESLTEIYKAINS